MGVAVLSGTIASLEPTPTANREKWEIHTPGTSTPTNANEKALPSRFIACVNRPQSVSQLLATFSALGPRGQAVEAVAGANVQSVLQSDVVILA
jgi:pyrroline-5-carboxylate reductase